MTLSDKIEHAGEGSRELDAFVRCAILNKPDAFVERSPINGAWCVYDGTKDRQGRPRPARDGGPKDYTTSLDAAMTLVPEGQFLELDGPRTYLNIPTPVPNYWSANITTFNHEGQRKGWGATPALALCAAALRARGL